MRLYEGLLNKLMEDTNIDDVYVLDDFYKVSRDYLKEKAAKSNLGITDAELDKALSNPDTDILSMPDDPEGNSFNRAFRQFAVSVSTGGHMAGSIVFEYNEKAISYGTDGFNPIVTAQKTPEQLYDDIKAYEDNGLGKVRYITSSYNTWIKYCKSLVSGAQYMCSQRFQDANGVPNIKSFKDYFNAHNNNIKNRIKLAREAGSELYNAKFAYAADWFKELGATKFSKPDVHILEVLDALDLIYGDDDKYGAFEKVDQIAEACHVTPYQIDKVIWLNCSGEFYTLKDANGKSKKIAIDIDESMKDDYIRYLKAHLAKKQ